MNKLEKVGGGQKKPRSTSITIKSMKKDKIPLSLPADRSHDFSDIKLNTVRLVYNDALLDMIKVVTL